MFALSGSQFEGGVRPHNVHVSLVHLLTNLVLAMEGYLGLSG